MEPRMKFVYSCEHANTRPERRPEGLAIKMRKKGGWTTAGSLGSRTLFLTAVLTISVDGPHDLRATEFCNINGAFQAKLVVSSRRMGGESVR